MRTIIELSNIEARKTLQDCSFYCTIPFPSYVNFEEILENLLGIGAVAFTSAKQYGDVNYQIMFNKDGKYAWRNLQILNPLVYSSLVLSLTTKSMWKKIVDRYNENDSKSPNIIVCGLPLEKKDKTNRVAESIKNWLDKIENESIILSFEYNSMMAVDISNFYDDIYSHSFTWIYEDRDEIKGRQGRKASSSNPGDIIDKGIQAMCYGETKGIPQGSQLMDFFAELFLNLVDVEVELEIKKLNSDLKNFKILRYRDDYRIFGENEKDVKTIIKAIAIVLSRYKLRLNSNKTSATDNLLINSIKQDKVFDKTKVITKKITNKYDVTQNLLVVQEIVNTFGNSKRASIHLQKLIIPLKNILQNLTKKDIEVILAFLADIMYKCPSSYGEAIALISILFQSTSLSKEDKKRLTDKIFTKVNNSLNTEYFELWMQRILLKNDIDYIYKGVLAQEIQNRFKAGTAMNNSIWNFEWAKTLKQNNNKTIDNIIDNSSIFDQDAFEKLHSEISREEVNIFSIIMEYEK